MLRAGLLMLALACAVLPGAAHAQQMVGLPLVMQEGGWARYTLGKSTELVVRVGASERHEGQEGRWLLFEQPLAGVGRVTTEYLLVGERFAPDAVVRRRVRMPQQPVREAKEAPGPKPKALPTPKLVRKKTETVAEQRLEVSEYVFPDGTRAGWSPSVPGLGLTRMSGVQTLRLVAFGVGGDPWKGAKSESPGPKAPRRP